MKVPQAITRWLSNRKFPIRWLTYKRRIALDIERAFQEEGAQYALDDEYIDKLATPIRQVEGWIIKLMSLQLAVTAFFVFGFISNTSSISLFGVSLTNVAGLKEILLAFWFTLGLITIILSTKRDLLIFIAERIFLRTENEKLLPFTKLSLPDVFNMRVYVTREYDDWIFATVPTKMIFGFMAFLLLGAFAGLIIFSSVLSIFLLYEVYENPTLGGWSYALLIYSVATFTAGLLWFIRFNLPLPYRDKSGLKSRPR